MSCLTGANSAFIQSVADKLGASSGYTKSVGGNGTDWFIFDNGTLVSKVRVPEPASGLVFATFMLLISRRRYRRAA
jgi:hypothetical protein